MANITASLKTELDHLRKDLKRQRKLVEMSIIDPDYYKKSPKPCDEEIGMTILSS